MGKVIDFSVILKESANLPMVRINRSDFLKTALSPYYDSQTVEMAIEYTPAQAGISTEEIKKLQITVLTMKRQRCLHFLF